MDSPDFSFKGKATYICPMQNLTLAVAQFQPRDGEKAYNLSVMAQLARAAKAKGASVVSFHEMCITAYTFMKDLSREEMASHSEAIPNGPSTQQLIKLAADLNLILLAGLLEEADGHYYNTYIAVDGKGLIARFRKLHAFISPHISSGSEYVLFDLKGWKCGILICYDNNVIENVRATKLLGAELIFAPHVTGCTPSAMPGRGYVADELWQNRATDPVPLRMEFDGPKGRGWLMKWLPARAYDNGVYYAFTNPIGYDGAHLKNGNSMIIDPYGEILSEIKSFDNTITIATLTKDKLHLAGGYRYTNARRPKLYKDILSQDHESVIKPAWMKS